MTKEIFNFNASMAVMLNHIHVDYSRASLSTHRTKNKLFGRKVDESYSEKVIICIRSLPLCHAN